MIVPLTMAVIQIGEAHAVLSDPRKRQQFDAGIDPNDPTDGMGMGDPFAGGGFPGGGVHIVRILVYFHVDEQADTHAWPRLDLRILQISLVQDLEVGSEEGLSEEILLLVFPLEDQKEWVAVDEVEAGGRTTLHFDASFCIIRTLGI